MKPTWKSLALVLPLLAACGGAPQQQEPAPESAQAALTTPTATTRFLTGWRTEQRGAIVRGGQLVVDYDLYRMTDCHQSVGEDGKQDWETRAYVRFFPGGQLFQGSVKRATGDLTFERQPYTVTVPTDATSVQLWFFTTGSDCTSRWDSNYGNNYPFPVEAQSPSAVVWAGDWGNGFNRECVHRDGLSEPVVIDSWVWQRACKWVDADVYVPGVTDAATARPELIQAQVEYTLNGGPMQYEWLEYQGRVGNNHRWRWLFGNQPIWYPDTGWSQFKFAFRYSTDGVNWYRIGQGDGPTGGDARTINRAY